MESSFSAPKTGRWKLLAFVLVLLVGILIAPTVVTKTRLLDRVVHWAAPELDGRLDYGSVKASWFSPLEVHQVTLRDLDNQTMLRAERISTGRTLWGLVTDRTNLGLIHIAKPELSLRVDEDGSNLEDLFAKLSPEEPGDSAAEAVAVQLQIDNGLIAIQDLMTSQSWRLSQLVGKLSLPANVDEPLTGAIYSQLSDGQVSGEFSGQFEFMRPQPGAIPTTVNSPLPHTVGRGQLDLETTNFPLSLLNVTLRRSQLEGAVVGHCDAELNCQWGDLNGQAIASVFGQIQLNNARAALPAYLGNDQLTFVKATATIDSRIENDVITAHTINITTDHGQIRFSGAAPLSELTGQGLMSALLSPASKNHYRLEGRINLAELLATLPDTLQVRDGTTVTGGDLQFQLASALTDNHRDLSGTLHARELSAVRDGQSFRWSQPVQIEFQGISNTGGLQIEQATCNSDFFEAQAAGRVDQGNLRASADLNRLSLELGQFFDLQGHQLAGTMDATIQWRQIETASMSCDARMKLSNFHYVTPHSETWNESLLTIEGNATLGVDSYSIQDVQAGSVTVKSVADSLTMTLTQPVADPATASWPLHVTVTGDIRNWLTRARPWFTADSWTVAGNVQAEINGSFSPQLVDIEQAHATVRNLEFTHSDIRVSESVAQLQGVATWDAQTGQVRSPWFTLTGTTVALRGENWELHTIGDAVMANGQAAFRADIGKIYHWFQDPSDVPLARTIGVAEGRLQARARGTAVAFSLNSTVRDFAYEQAAEPNQNFAIPPSSPWNTVWSEPSVTVTSAGQYDTAVDQLVFESINLAGESVQIDATGQLTALSVAPHADLTGRLTYDLQRIVSQLRLGPMIQVFGRQSHTFAIQGPLLAATVSVAQPVASASPVPTTAASMSSGVQVLQPLVSPDLNARATIGWDGASIYGVPLGPGQLAAQLSQGVVMTSPLDVQVGPSQIHLAPTVHLNANPMTMVFEPGPLAQKVEITPELCSSWLKYVTPLLSNAAVAEGSFSVDLAAAQVPVTDPLQATVGGKLTIHEARLQPGPLAGQIVAIADQVTQLIGEKKQNLDFLNADRSWIDIRENQVEFQMQQGRVYHRDLNVAIGKVNVSSEGWVAIDQTMSMIASIPVLDQWIDGEPLLAGLKGRKLSIPIQGSFANPQVDRQALTRLSKDLVGNAAQHYLQGELQKGLQKLLKGR